MGESETILSYASAKRRPPRPLHPIYAMLVLIASLAPIVTAFFLPSGRQAPIASTMVCFGTLLSPLTFTVSVFLVRRYRGYAKRRAVAGIACALSGITLAYFVFGFVYLLFVPVM